MSRFSILVPAGLLACAALAGCRSTDDTQEAALRSADAQAVEATAPQEGGLPPGMTEEDMAMMQACIEAGTPGEMHAFLAEGAGSWEGKSSMWMAPGTEPIPGTSSTKMSMIMDGRYATYEYSGDSPMGPFKGFGLYGFDNVSQKFACTWIDSMSTGMMNGTGELSADKKTLTWTFTYNDPVTKKPATMREIERITGDNTRTLDMFMKDPKSGVEYQMMHIELTRRSN